MKFEKGLRFMVMKSHLGGAYLISPDDLDMYTETCEQCGDFDYPMGTFMVYDYHIENPAQLLCEVDENMEFMGETIEVAELLGLDGKYIEKFILGKIDEYESLKQEAEEFLAQYVEDDADVK